MVGGAAGAGGVALAAVGGSSGALDDGSEAAGADVAAGAESQLGGSALFLWFGRAPLCLLAVVEDVWAGFDTEGWACADGFCGWVP